MSISLHGFCTRDDRDVASVSNEYNRVEIILGYYLSRLTPRGSAPVLDYGIGAPCDSWQAIPHYTNKPKGSA